MSKTNPPAPMMPPEAAQGLPTQASVYNMSVFDMFFEEVLPQLPDDCIFYQPSAFEHYGQTLIDALNGTVKSRGWVFTCRDQKLIWAQKLPENATSELTK